MFSVIPVSSVEVALGAYTFDQAARCVLLGCLHNGKLVEDAARRAMGTFLSRLPVFDDKKFHLKFEDPRLAAIITETAETVDSLKRREVSFSPKKAVPPTVYVFTLVVDGMEEKLQSSCPPRILTRIFPRSTFRDGHFLHVPFRSKQACLAVAETVKYVTRETKYFSPDLTWETLLQCVASFHLSSEVLVSPVHRKLTSRVNIDGQLAVFANLRDALMTRNPQFFSRVIDTFPPEVFFAVIGELVVHPSFEIDLLSDARRAQNICICSDLVAHPSIIKDLIGQGCRVTGCPIWAKVHLTVAEIACCPLYFVTGVFDPSAAVASFTKSGLVLSVFEDGDGSFVGIVPVLERKLPSSFRVYAHQDGVVTSIQHLADVLRPKIMPRDCFKILQFFQPSREETDELLLMKLRTLTDFSSSVAVWTLFALACGMIPGVHRHAPLASSPF